MKLQLAAARANGGSPRVHLRPKQAKIEREGREIPKGDPLPGQRRPSGARSEQSEARRHEGDAAYTDVREEPEWQATKLCDAHRPARSTPERGERRAAARQGRPGQSPSGKQQSYATLIAPPDPPRLCGIGWAIAALLAMLPLPAFAQGTLANYQRADQFLMGNLARHIRLPLVNPVWIGHSGRFWYVRNGPRGRQFILVNAARNTAGPAFDQARIAAALSAATRQTVAANRLPFLTFRYVPGQPVQQAIQFNFHGAGWTCSLQSYHCAQGPPIPALFPHFRYGPPPAPQGPAAFENVSPNGRWTAFVRGHNLFVRSDTGTVVQLTYDGKPGDDYATPLPDLRTLIREGVTDGDDVRERPAVFWSPDSNQLITYRLDSRNAGRYISLQFVPPHQLRPIAYSYVYPLPGEILPKAYPVIFNLTTGQRVDVHTPPLSIQFQGGPYFRWLNNHTVFYEYDGRGEKYIGLREINAATGAQRVLYRETAKPYPYVDPGESQFRFVDHDQQFLWASERTGWNQLYRYDAQTGHLINAVTHGDWVVRRIVSVNEKRHEIYFLAAGVNPAAGARANPMDPYYTQLYRVNFDGTGLRLLTPGNADHSASVSPDGRYVVDNFSTVSDPGESVLRRASDGSVIRVLERPDIAWLRQQGWTPPIHFQGLAADGQTKLYGVIVRPAHFDPHKKYAVLENIYTGPQGFFAPKSFSQALRLESMAQLGFVVVMLDGRGTAGRSRAFHDFSYHNMGNVFVDHVAMIKQMGAKYPWMDLSRVGIYGTSAGGYGSAHAFLQFPGFYKVCVSTSGDHDPRMDKAWWNELYQGWPVGKDYAQQANEALVKNLQGHLLLIHGDIDDNVNPAETMRLVDALMTANKPFDMLLVPNMYHGDSGPHARYVTLRRWNYFVRYLLGVPPPAHFVIHVRPRRNF